MNMKCCVDKKETLWYVILLWEGEAKGEGVSRQQQPFCFVIGAKGNWVYMGASRSV